MGEINMLVAKFVDDNYRQGNTSYSNFGIPVEKYMLVWPINEDVDINPNALNTKSILLEISEENIIYCQRNSAFHVNKAMPVRELNDDELSILRIAACQHQEWAYYYARYVDQKPTDETRNATCKEPYYAYNYAKYVDRKPTSETRFATCQHSEFAFYYAIDVDKKPTDETRIAACKDPCYAYLYAKDVDRKPTSETRINASKNQYYKNKYEHWEAKYVSSKIC
jgi:hypothetical protein